MTERLFWKMIAFLMRVFLFCEFFLDKFKNNKKIAGITGNNFQKEKIQETFYYSKFSSIWGWATWRRVWKTYDLKIKF